jgi:RimJ/RimL family protein N-acetyltransferase
MYGPVIEGAKCKLRPHIEKDAHLFVQMLADPEVNKYLSMQSPPSIRAELEWIEARAKDPRTLGWTVEVDGKCVGYVGVDAIDWRNGHGTVGIFIGRSNLWGKGITSEAAQLVARYVFTQTPLRKIKAGYLAPNVASAKAQARIGLREVGRWHAEYFRDGQWVDHVLTELTREEWVAGQLSR